MRYVRNKPGIDAVRCEEGFRPPLLTFRGRPVCTDVRIGVGRLGKEASVACDFLMSLSVVFIGCLLLVFLDYCVEIRRDHF